MIRRVDTGEAVHVECDHSDAVLARRLIGGHVNAGLWCRDCGHWEGRTKRGLDLEALPEYHELPYTATRIHEERQKLFAERRDAFTQKRDDERSAMLERYRKYLRTDKWAQKRELVLRRANGLCESCRTNKATQVHHTTYTHLENEPLWELRAVCRPCHELITQIDREHQQ